MNKKIRYAIGGVLVALFAFVGIAVAGGIGPFGVKLGGIPAEIQNLIKGPEKLPATDRLTGCDSSATSTDCATIRTSEPAEQATKGLSTATAYTEVAATKQSGMIDDRLTVNNTLKNISFCGKLSRTRQVIINGVDVGQRIAELASKDQMGYVPGGDSPQGESFGRAICNTLPLNVPEMKGVLEMRDVITPQTNTSQTPSNNYTVIVGTYAFVIDPITNEIFNVGAYDGTLFLVGKLK